MTTPRILLICLVVYLLLVGGFVGLAGELDSLDWATLAVTCVFHFVVALLCAHDKGLFRERLKPGPGAPLWDRIFVRFMKLVMLANLVVVPLDIGHFHWKEDLPDAWRIVGLVGIAIGMLFTAWVMRTNTFFSSVVRLQEDRGHHLIQEGPYGLVRHPGYVGILLFFASFNLGFGRWSGVAFAALWIVLLVARIIPEERFLHRHLDGYGDYTQQVRWRLIPWIW